MVEGMAEYLSVGPKDSHTAMWLRDALLRDDLPTIADLTTSGRYFPYRYGEALWAYIAGTWGDEMVTKLFRESLQHMKCWWRKQYLAGRNSSLNYCATGSTMW
jgi:hypothetical protein